MHKYDIEYKTVQNTCALEQICSEIMQLLKAEE